MFSFNKWQPLPPSNSSNYPLRRVLWHFMSCSQLHACLPSVGRKGQGQRIQLNLAALERAKLSGSNIYIYMSKPTRVDTGGQIKELFWQQLNMGWSKSAFSHLERVFIFRIWWKKAPPVGLYSENETKFTHVALHAQTSTITKFSSL